MEYHLQLLKPKAISPPVILNDNPFPHMSSYIFMLMDYQKGQKLHSFVKQTANCTGFEFGAHNYYLIITKLFFV